MNTGGLLLIDNQSIVPERLLEAWSFDYILDHDLLGFKTSSKVLMDS